MTLNPAGSSREPVSFLVFSASLRDDALNTRLARLVSRIIGRNGGTADFASMADFDAPSFSQDAQARTGLPAGTLEFCRRLETNDAFVIASPEYNASMPGVLKNAIDWASRKRPQPFHEKQALLLSASPSMSGGNRGLWSLRIPLEHLGARVFPDMFSLAQAHQNFEPDGNLINAELGSRLEKTVLAFMDLVEAAKHYPCMKKEWVEFLGEMPTPAIDRVE